MNIKELLDIVNRVEAEKPKQFYGYSSAELYRESTKNGFTKARACLRIKKIKKVFKL